MSDPRSGPACIIVMLASFGLAAIVSTAALRRDPPRVAYQLTYVQAPVPEWRVTIEAANLPNTSIALELSDFGSWTNLADYYLTQFTIAPPATRDPENASRWILQPTSDWDGKLHAEYSLHAAAEGTPAQHAYALLPVRTDSYTYGCTANTLLKVFIDGKLLDEQRTVTITPPDGWQVFSGWTGDSPGVQIFEMHPRDRNGLIMMGNVASSADVVNDKVSIHVRQFGAGPPSAEKVAAWLGAVAPLMIEVTGADPGPIRVFLTDSAGGGMMTDRGLMVGVRREWSAADVDLESTRHTVCHELFHAWLGGMLRPDESMTWFMEGFTDYLSLWHAAAAGVIPHDWFVRRLAEFADAAKNSSLGQISFIDEGVSWRDNNGPNETMAYAGAHIVAFALDVELRNRGHKNGVRTLIADLLRSDTSSCTRDDLHSWFKSNNVEDLWAAYIAGRTVPDVDALLKSIGCIPGFVPLDLTYVGVRAEEQPPGEPFRARRILEIDPAGPAALAGAKVGDRITGWFPARQSEIEIGPEVTTPFTFGLTSFAPGYPGTYMGVVRGEEELKLEITPRLIPGGRRPCLQPGPEFAQFLKHEPMLRKEP